MNTEEKINCILEAHKLYKAAYALGVIGISTDYIQMDERGFKELFTDPEKIKAKWQNRDIELSTTVNGLRFITLADVPEREITDVLNRAKTSPVKE